MKKVYFVFLLSIFMFSCNLNQSSNNTEKHQLNFVDLEIKVDGMTCEGCENTVQLELQKLDGVGEVVASHIEKSVKVKIDTSINNIKELESEIERVGYTIIK